MDKYQCRACPNIYDPAIGDSSQGFKGTKFEDMPDDWLYPECGVLKSIFDKI